MVKRKSLKMFQWSRKSEGPSTMMPRLHTENLDKAWASLQMHTSTSLFSVQEPLSFHLLRNLCPKVGDIVKGLEHMFTHAQVLDLMQVPNGPTIKVRGSL